MSRNPNLDLIRALAIAFVLVHHLGQHLPHLPTAAHQYTSLGAHGVDLFFVLSGWLIGSLYWKERQQFGNVEVVRFWGRRWLRTIPPYLAVLPVTYVGRYLASGEPFDLRYLLFLQNYEEVLPFFLVSWSLCVEEHFYLFMPVVISSFTFLRFPVRAALPALFLVSCGAKFLDPSAHPGQGFGYADTASHLNLSGLVLGVWFSYLAIHEEALWIRIQNLCKVVVFPLFLGFLLIPLLSPSHQYYLADNYVTLFFGAVLASLTAIPSLRISRLKITYLLSISSYSIYLTHSVVLMICLHLTDKLGLYREAMCGLWTLAILAAGYLVFALVERPSIQLRDRWIPRRKKVAPQAQPADAAQARAADV